jgi:hypothetical protein
VDFDMTVCAVRVLRVQVVLWTGGLVGTHAMSRAVTRQTKLRNTTRNQQSRIRRTVWRVTRDATIGLHRRMFKNKRSLLVCVTLDASSVSASR